MTRSLDTVPDDFWYVQVWPLSYSEGRPLSVQQALLEMNDESWNKMVDALFGPDWHREDLSINDVMTLIRETNTCEGLNSELDVWIDEAGDFKIKVYYV